MFPFVRSMVSDPQIFIPINFISNNIFHNSYVQGASFVEFDVQLTKDHVPVVFHDDFVAVISDEVNKC